MEPLDLLGVLLRLKAPRVLLEAAYEGAVQVAECAMPVCRCPEGRGHFEPVAAVRNLWAPSADRWPVPGREGGEYVVGNVRLAHFSCNAAEGGAYAARANGLGLRSGANNPRARITQPEVDEIRAVLAGDPSRSYREIAALHGVSYHIVKAIAEGKHWGVRGQPRIVRQVRGGELRTSAWRKERRAPDFEAKRRTAMAAFWASPAGEAERAARAERARAQWADPAKREAAGFTNRRPR